jgi:hypothetical protein
MPGGSAEATSGHRLTAVVLGASNVSRGQARLNAVIRGRSAGPVGLFVAAGHGRSYGANSRVWMRRLPSILGCGVWRALDREGSDCGRLVAVVTDIGNDILYGSSPAQVAAWVREAVGRLVDRGATVALARLPLEAVRRVGPVRYRALKTLFVPGCPLSIAGIHSAAAELDGLIRDLAVAVGEVVHTDVTQSIQLGLLQSINLVAVIQEPAIKNGFGVNTSDRLHHLATDFRCHLMGRIEPNHGRLVIGDDFLELWNGE